MSDESFFRQTYAAYSKMVYNLCLNYLQNAEDAEEATQDVFVKVHQQMNRFRGTASVKTWMYRIAVNHCLDVIKAKKRRKRQGFFTSLQGPGEGDTGLVVPDFDHPGVKLEDKEAVEKLFALINALPDNQKTAILLKSIEGLPQKEIAEVMSLSEKAVESLLSRAKATLKLNLSQSEGKTR